MSKNKAAPKPRSAKYKRILKLTALAVSIILIYGAAIPPRRIKTTCHKVSITGLPEQLNGLRIAQISDLHVSPLFKAGSVRRIVEMTNDLHPDIVVITGDFVNYRSVKYLPEAVRELNKLKTRLGIYACLGNHDYWEGIEKIRQIIEQGNIKILSNENVMIAGGLYLAAVDDMMSGNPDINAALADIPEDAPALLLSHNPNILPEAADRDLLILSGHTHGGQIAAPFLGPRATIELPLINGFTEFYEELGAKAHHGRTSAVAANCYPEGWYREGKARMYVCRGTGFSLGVPIRLNCPPEIACFMLCTPKK